MLSQICQTIAELGFFRRSMINALNKLLSTFLTHKPPVPRRCTRAFSRSGMDCSQVYLCVCVCVCVKPCSKSVLQHTSGYFMHSGLNLSYVSSCELPSKCGTVKELVTSTRAFKGPGCTGFGCFGGLGGGVGRGTTRAWPVVAIVVQML